MTSLTQAMSQGSGSLAQAMSRAGYSPATPLNGFATLATKSATPTQTPFQTGSVTAPTTAAFTPSNVSKIPGQIKNAAKSVFNFLTGSEQALGGEIAAELPPSVTGEDELNKANEENAASDIAFIKAINAKKAAGEKLSTTQQQLYDHILQTNSSVGTQTDLLPHAADTNVQGLLNTAGVALDALAPTGIGKAADGANAVADALKLTPEEIAAQTAADTAKEAAKASQQTAKIAEVVSPKLTAAQTADALAARGGTKTGILGTIKANVDPAVTRIADTIAKYVPDFSPKKSLVENINATKNAVSSLAQDLKAKVVASGQDRIYSFKELGSTLNNLEKPTLLVGDLDKVYGNVVNKAMEIARSNGGKVSDLFQARKEFDDFVSKQFPNLYSSDTLTPMRSAIKNVRNALTDFTAEHLPPDVGLRDSLTHQSRLLEAIENMSEKAASGAQKEIGTNIIERATSALKNHPVIGGFGGIAAYETAKKIPVIGGLLP